MLTSAKIVHRTRDFKGEGCASGLGHDPEKWEPFSEKIVPKHKSDGSDPAMLDQTLWSKPFKDHLIRVAGGAFALLLTAHGPGQKRQAENIAGDPGRRRRQLVHPIGDEMRPGAECVS
jgi:hypothetical protein